MYCLGKGTALRKGTVALFVSLCMTLSLASCSSVLQAGEEKAIGHIEFGKASFYGMKHQSKKTASGETFKQAAKTAAHRTLPFDTKVKVTNTENGKSVIVRINDRGPFIKGRVIDLSQSAFKSIGDIDDGVITVKIEVVE